MPTETTSIAIIGASSPLGQTLLALLSRNPSYKITVLTRSSSTITFHPSIQVHKGNYTPAFLAHAFAGIHTIISLISPPAIPSQTTIIDAAITAGVTRFFPSEFSANTADPDVIKAVPFYESKVKIIEYLKWKQKETKGAFRWTALVPGCLLDLCLSTGEMGFDLRKKTAVVYNGGGIELDCMSLESAANAVLGCLDRERRGDGVDGYVYVRGLRTTQNEMLQVLKRVVPVEWSVDTGDAKERTELGWRRVNLGDFEGVVDVIWGVGYRTGLGMKFKKETKLMNEKLGLEEESLEEVIKNAWREVEKK